MKKIRNTVGFKQLGSGGPGPALSADKKNDRDDAPTHPLSEIPGTAHERHMWIKSGGSGPLTIAVFDRVCVGGGEGPVTSFNFRICRGLLICCPGVGGGGGVKLFSKGGEVQLLSNIT